MISKGLKVDQVFGRRVLIKLVKPYTELDQAEKAGLYIPEKEKHTPMPSTGIVVLKGIELDEEGYEGTNLAEGDMIMFSKYAGTDFRVDEEDYRILDINEVICRLVATEGDNTYESE